jgi:hypothetical protein
VLFLSNLLALVLGGIVVFSATGYAADAGALAGPGNGTVKEMFTGG